MNPITNPGRTLSALLGASPGVQARLTEMIPAWNIDIKDPTTAKFFREAHQKSSKILKLES